MSHPSTPRVNGAGSDACGCRETYPQLTPDRVSHGPGCSQAAPAATISWRGLTLALDMDADTPHWTYEDAEMYVGVCDETLKEPCSANIQVLGLTGEGIAGSVVEALEKALLDAKRNVYDAGMALRMLGGPP